ncbi:MAG TPA: hypothetical protein VF040_09345 [Ktedonobacterales bacterium]
MADQWEYCRIVLGVIGHEWKVVAASANTGSTYDLPGRAEPVDSVLESLGQQGWELVATFGEGAGGPQMVFKRRKP